MREFNVLETIIHDSLIVNLHNRRMLDVMDMVADNIYRERMIAMGSMDNVERSLEEHRLVVEAIVNHQPDEAAKLMEQHVRNVQQRIEKIVFDT
jgi:DNA-binding FadR family transcriptional regulator